MFITALVILFIIKLRFPKGKSIHHMYIYIYIYCWLYLTFFGQVQVKKIELADEIQILKYTLPLTIFHKQIYELESLKSKWPILKIL